MSNNSKQHEEDSCFDKGFHFYDTITYKEIEF